MKLTKRLILAVLCIALVLTSTLLVVTACDQEETGFKVTVAEYDNQQGTVSVSQPKEGKLYDEGEKVTVTVTPATDYKVATFTVSGHDDATLNNEGKYEFEISSDTTVTVTFVQNQPEPTTFTVTVGSVQNGTVKLDPEKDAYTEGESVTVTVTPATDYEVATFTVSGHDDAMLNDEGKYTFQVTANTTINVTFEKSTPPVPETVTVTVVEGNGAHVALSPETDSVVEGEDRDVYTFAGGTEVTVSVTFDEGFDLDIFYVNEVEEDLNEDDEFKFSVLEDTTIEVTAVRNFTQELLDSLKGTLKIEGELDQFYSEYDEHVPSTLSASYDVEKGLVWQWELYNGEYLSNLVLKADEDGNVVVPNRRKDGSVVWSYPVNSSDKELVVPFSEFANPFESLELSDFVYVGENTWELVDLELAAEVASAISGYGYTSIGLESFQLIEEDNAITTIKYTTREAMDSYDDTYVHIADLTVTRGSITIPTDLMEPYAEQQELEQALQVAREAVTYTVHYTDDCADAPEDYMLYRAEKAIWVDDDENSYAFVERPDGTVWKLVYGKDGKTFEFSSDIATSPAMDRISALFDLSGYSASFFEETEEGVYTLRSTDTSLAYYFALSFATAYQLDAASYATNITITLDNGVLSTVEYDYFYDAYYYTLSGHVVIEFSNFGQTTVPATVELPADLINGKFAQDVLGTWLDDENGSRVDIALDSITIDGVETSKIVANEDNSYTVTLGTETYTVKKTENGKLSVQSSKGTVEYRFRATPWENLIGEYSGVEDYSEYYGWKIELAITAEGLTLTLDGESDTLTPDDFTFVEDGDTVGICFPFSETTYGTVYAYIVSIVKGQVTYFYGEDDFLGYTYFGGYLYSEDYVADFSDYYGTFTLIGGEDMITISESGIKMVLDGETYEVATEDVEYYPVEYQVRLFQFEVDGVQCVLQQYGSSFGKVTLFIEDEFYGSFVSGDYQHSAWTQYVGTFNGEDADGNKYQVVITEDEVVFKKNGQDQTITGIDFDKYLMTDGYDDFWLYQFNFYVGNVRWGLQQLEEGTDYNGLFLFFEGEDEDTTLCVVYRDQYKVIEDYSDYYGTYQNGDTKVVISAEGITVTVESVDVTATTNVQFGSNFDYDSESVFYFFSLVWNGKACMLQVCDEGNAMLFVVDPESKTSQTALLIDSEYVAPDLSTNDDFIDDWSRYYETDDGLNSINITDKGEIQVVLGGQPVEDAEVVYYGVEGGLIIKLNGRTYQLVLGQNSDYKYIITAVDEDGTELVFTQCDPVSDKSWESYFGTWTGTGTFDTDTGYESKDVVVVISDGAITLQIDGGEVMNAINPKLRTNGYTLIFTFTAGGVYYHMYDYTDSETPYLNLSDYGYNMSASLYRLNWNDLVGFYDNEAGDRDTDGEVCYITIQPTSITIQIQGSSPVTIEASDIEFKIEDNGEFTYSVFYFTYNDVECMLMELSEGGLMFTDIDFEDKYYIIVYLNGVVGGGDSDSPWPNFDGFWTGTTDEQEPRSVAIEIDGEYIFLTVGDDDGFEAINPSLVGSVLSFMCGGEEYTLTIVGDQLRVYNDTWGWEAMCDKFEQGGGDEGDWSEFDGVWEGSDAEGTVYKVEFNSVSGRIDVTLGEDIVLARNVEVGEGLFGTKVTFTANGVNYIFEDDGAGGARFHDEDGDVDVTLTRKGSDSGDDGDEVDYSFYAGEYFGKGDIGEVEIVITKDSITIKIDGVEQNVTVVSYTADDNGFTLDIDGTTYHVYSMEESNITAVFFTDNHSPVRCTKPVG